jgi:hypothetical protein
MIPRDSFGSCSRVSRSKSTTPGKFLDVLLGFDKHLNSVLKECEECRFRRDDVLLQPRGLIVLHWINVQRIAANTLAAPPGRDCRSLWQRNISTVSPVAAAPT